MQAITVVFLTDCIPKSYVDSLIDNHHTGQRVVGASGDLFNREGIGGIGHDKAGLSDSTVLVDYYFGEVSVLERGEDWS